MSVREFSFRSSSDAQREYVGLARKRAGKLLHASYLIPGTEVVFEVHNHVELPRDAQSGARRGVHVLSTIRHYRTAEATTIRPRREELQYTQQGVIFFDDEMKFFSDDGTAVRRDQMRHLETLETEGGSLLYRYRPIMDDSESPTDEALGRDNEVMRQLTKGDKIIRVSVFPSHIGRTRNEVKEQRRRRRR